MLKITEIKQFMDEDFSSTRKVQARKGLRYYEAHHDIEDYRVYYVNDKGDLVEDTTRSNITISHPFFTEHVDQCAQYMLSGDDYIVKSDIPELQAELNKYFDDEFKMELNDLITYTKIEGDSFLYRFIDDEMKTRFKFADGLNVVEVPAKYASDKIDHVIYYYYYKTEKDKDIIKIQVWDKDKVFYYKMIDSQITKDTDEKLNPKPHVIYEEDGQKYYDAFGDVPFIRLDNNRKRTSDLFVIKDLIDDYDLMACGLSNNLQDVAEGIYVVKGWQGNDLDELTRNVKVKKQVSVGEGGDLDIKTIQVPYQARVAKMEQDEKNIYRFGMALNTSLVGEGNATNYILKSRYALLEMKCKKLESNLKRMMKKIIKIIIDEINTNLNKQYKYSDVWVEFKREVMTNAMDNAQIEQVKAQTEQVKVNTLLALAQTLDNETIVKEICTALDVDYSTIKDKLPKPQTIEEQVEMANQDLENMIGDES